MKLNWGFGMLVAYVIFAGSMVLFAIKASQQNNDLVSEDYYEDAVKFQAKIDAKLNALDSSSLIYANFINESSSIEIFAFDSLLNTFGKIDFYKPDDSNKDFSLNFKINRGVRSIYYLKSIPSGEWKMNISWTIDQNIYFQEKRISVN
jgi:hypothetical protein